MSNTQTQENKQPKAAALISVETGNASDSQTGAPVQQQPNPETLFQQVTVAKEEFVNWAKSQGFPETVAKIEGKKYEPTFADNMKRIATRSKASLITVGWALLPGGLLVLLYEGIRFAIPATRSWPGFIKYKPSQLSGNPKLPSPK